MDGSSHESHRFCGLVYNINLTKKIQNVRYTLELLCQLSVSNMQIIKLNRPKISDNNDERFGEGYIGASQPNLKLNNN